MPAPLTAQLGRPLFSLTQAQPGEHVVTVNVTPDNLGPVTVRAHVTGEGIRVELFAPNELGRDALRAIMADLRRDLSSSGMNTQLDLSSQDQPNQRKDSADDSASGNSPAPEGRQATAGQPQLPAEHTTTHAPMYGMTSTIDVMA